MENKLIQVGKICHEVHRAYCKEINSKTQPEWVNITNQHKEVILNSVKQILDGKINSPDESHNNFIKVKEEQGWVYSEKYSIENKTNPRLVPFENLSSKDRMKEILFFTIVSSFKINK